jgi:hypothetical protein
MGKIPIRHAIMICASPCAAGLVFGSKSLGGDGTFLVLTAMEVFSCIGKHFGDAGGWRWPIVSVCAGSLCKSTGSCLCMVPLIVSL